MFKLSPQAEMLIAWLPLLAVQLCTILSPYLLNFYLKSKIKLKLGPTQLVTLRLWSFGAFLLGMAFLPMGPVPATLAMLGILLLSAALGLFLIGLWLTPAPIIPEDILVIKNDNTRN